MCVCNWIKLTENNKAEEGAATEKNKQKRCQLKNFVFGYSHRQRTRTANRKGWLDREKDKVSKRERERERGGSVRASQRTWLVIYVRRGEVVACSNLKTAKCTENLIKKGFSGWQKLLGFFAADLATSLAPSLYPQRRTMSSASATPRAASAVVVVVLCRASKSI